MIVELSQQGLNGLRIPAKYARIIMDPIFKGKSDIKNCSCYRAMTITEDGMKVAEMVIEKNHHRVVTLY